MGSKEKKGRGAFEWGGYLIVIVGVWLAWEIVKAPVAARAPPSIAIRLAPKSPEVLRRAAESELSAGHLGNAQALATDALAHAPFDARALRVRGLTEARTGDLNRADEMLTLAGNWSLRDDQAHAWLTERRLKNGDYTSSFAHADTLARRRTDLYSSIFRLFEEAAKSDTRSLPILAKLLAAGPPWRAAFLNYLYQDASRAPILGGLAITLEPTSGRFTTEELHQLYVSWAIERRIVDLKEVRRRVGRPFLSKPLQNGDFETVLEEQILPFGWRLAAAPGISSSVVNDDVRPRNHALRIDYDGFGSGLFTEQLTFLGSGPHRLEGALRTETSTADLRMEWQLLCVETGGPAPSRATRTVETTAWQPFGVVFDVPSENCSAQWLRLTARPGERRTAIGIWFDDIEVRSGAGGSVDR